MVRNNLLLTAGEGLLSFKGAFSGFGDGLGMVSTSDRSAEEERSAASQNQPWFGGEESSAAFVSIRLLFESESCRACSSCRALPAPTKVSQEVFQAASDRVQGGLPWLTGGLPATSS